METGIKLRLADVFVSITDPRHADSRPWRLRICRFLAYCLGDYLYCVLHITNCLLSLHPIDASLNATCKFHISSNHSHLAHVAFTGTPFTTTKGKINAYRRQADKQTTIPRLIAAMTLGCLSWYTNAAIYDPQEFAALQRIAAEKQYVRVIVDLNINVPLGDPKKHSAALKGRLAATEAALVKSLGNGALKTGSWRNDLGQIGLYVNDDGLNGLTDNENVRAFGIDPTGLMRTGVYEDDGRVSRIISEIERNGYADVEATLNLENLDFDIGRDANVVHKPTTAQQVEVQSKLPALRASLLSRRVEF